MLFGNVIFIKKNGADGSKFPVTERSIKIGRSEDCLIRIQNPHVSSEHCQLIVDENGQAKLRNLATTNRTLLNDQPLGNGEFSLYHGDIFKLGERLARWEYLTTSKYYHQNLSTAGRLVAVVIPQQRSAEEIPTPGASNAHLKLDGTPVGLRKSLKSDSTSKKQFPITGSAKKVANMARLLTGRHSLQAKKMLFSPQPKQRKSTIGVIRSKTPQSDHSDKSPRTLGQSPWKVKSLSPRSGGKLEYTPNVLKRKATPLKTPVPRKSAFEKLIATAGRSSAKIPALKTILETSPSFRKDVLSPRKLSPAKTPLKTPGTSKQSRQESGREPSVSKPKKTPSRALRESFADLSSTPKLKTPFKTPTKQSIAARSPVSDSARISSAKKVISTKRTPYKSASKRAISVSSPVSASKRGATPRKSSRKVDSPAKSSEEKSPQVSPGKIASPSKISAFALTLSTPRNTASGTKTPKTSPKKLATPKLTPAKLTALKQTVTPKQSATKTATPRQSPQKTTPKSSPKNLVAPRKSSPLKQSKAVTPRSSPQKISSGKKTPTKIKTPSRSPQRVVTPKQTSPKIPTATKSRGTPQQSPTKSSTVSPRKTPKASGSPRKSIKASPQRGTKRKLSPALDSAERAAKKLKTSAPVQPDKNKLAALFVLGKAGRKTKPGPTANVLIKQKIVKKAIKQSTRVKKPIVRKTTVKKLKPVQKRSPVKKTPVKTPRKSNEVLGFAKARVDTPYPRARSVASADSPAKPNSVAKSPKKSQTCQPRSPSKADILPTSTPRLNQNLFDTSNVSTVTSKHSSAKLRPSNSSFDSRRSSKRISSKTDQGRPEFTELSPTALGLTPRNLVEAFKTPRQKNRRSSSLTTPKSKPTPGIMKSASTSKVDKRKSVRFLKDESLGSSFASGEGTTFDFEGIKTPNITTDVFVSPLKSARKPPKSPKNDLSDVTGVRRLLKTPKTPKSPKNDLRDVRGVKHLYDPPKSPKNDLTDVRGVRRLLKISKSPRNDLTDVTGIKQLLIARSPRNDLSDVRGVKALFGKSPKNDLTNIRGLRTIFSPQKSPKNDLRDIKGIRDLFAMSKAGNNLDVSLSGVSELFRSPVASTSRSSRKESMKLSKELQVSLKKLNQDLLNLVDTGKSPSPKGKKATRTPRTGRKSVKTSPSSAERRVRFDSVGEAEASGGRRATRMRAARGGSPKSAKAMKRKLSESEEPAKTDQEPKKQAGKRGATKATQRKRQGSSGDETDSTPKKRKEETVFSPKETRNAAAVAARSLRNRSVSREGRKKSPAGKAKAAAPTRGRPPKAAEKPVGKTSRAVKAKAVDSEPTEVSSAKKRGRPPKTSPKVQKKSGEASKISNKQSSPKVQTKSKAPSKSPSPQKISPVRTRRGRQVSVSQKSPPKEQKKKAKTANAKKAGSSKASPKPSPVKLRSSRRK